MVVGILPTMGSCGVCNTISTIVVAGLAGLAGIFEASIEEALKELMDE